MTTIHQKRSLEWIDQFIFDHYRPPCLADIAAAGFRSDTLGLADDRAEMIARGDLLPSEDEAGYFIPAWFKSFVDFQAHKGAGYKKLMEAIREHGHHKVIP